MQGTAGPATPESDESTANAAPAERPVGAVLSGGLVLLTGLKGFVVWLTGSVAGLTAVLYGIGYLVTRAHFSVLGLYGFAEVGNDYFLQEGAKFFVVVGYKIARAAAPLLAVLAFLALVVFVIWLLARFALRRLTPGARLGDVGQRLRSRLLSIRNADFWRASAFVLFLFAALNEAGTSVIASQRPLCIANLLYATGQQGQCGGTTGHADAVAIREALLAGDTATLDLRFESILFGIAGTSILIYLAWRLAPAWRHRGWLLAPLLLALALFAILLPMDYGVLERPISYPLVRITPNDGQAEIDQGPLFLMNKTDSGFVVWSATSRHVVWLPNSGIKRAEISSVENLFHAQGAQSGNGGAP